VRSVLGTTFCLPSPKNKQKRNKRNPKGEKGGNVCCKNCLSLEQPGNWRSLERKTKDRRKFTKKRRKNGKK
jgi:hypothetical protein